MYDTFLSVFCEGSYLGHILEKGGLGSAFVVLLLFVLQQFRRLMEQVSSLQTMLVGVVEKNTEAYGSMQQAFERLSEKYNVLLGN